MANGVDKKGYPAIYLIHVGTPIAVWVSAGLYYEKVIRNT